MNSRSSMCVAGLLVRGALCAFLAMGCTPGDPTGNDTTTTPQELPDGYAENRGQYLPILEISTHSAIRWEDPAEIVFNTVGSGVVQRITAIRALRLSELSSRTLHTGGNVNYLGYRGIEVSPDGSQIYSVLSKPLATDIDVFHIVPGAAPVTVAISPKSYGSTTKNAAIGAAILPMPDSRGAAYTVAPDSMRLYDVATRTSHHIGEGCSTPVAFSPDGKRLFCRTGNSFFVMTVSDGSIERVSVQGGLPVSVFWGTRGLQVLVETSSGEGLSLVDVATGAATTLVKAGQFRQYEYPYYFQIAWSRDGRKVAVATRRAEVFDPVTPEFVVYVIDTQTAATQRAAVIKLPESGLPDIGQMAFSPDGRNIAYVAGTSSSAEMYLAPVQ